MNAKHHLLCLGVIVLCLCGIVGTTALAGTVDNFSAVQSYEQGTFTDIDADDWFYANVIRMYEYGLVNGVGDNLFLPRDNISVAALLTLACRVHACYNGYEAPQNGLGVWYEPYVRYAQNAGIISADRLTDDYERAATRAEAAYILSRILPAEELASVNSVEYLPDVLPDDPYYAEILYLYIKGIIKGRDDYGDYFPEENITRAEVMTILLRLIDKSNTQSVSISRPQSEAELTAELLRLINLQRAQAGLAPLGTSEALTAAAQSRAAELSASRSHTRPDGSEFYTVLAEHAVSYSLTAENIAAGQTSPLQVVHAWMNSPDHRNIILNSELRSAACGHFLTAYGMHCWTALFIAE